MLMTLVTGRPLTRRGFLSGVSALAISPFAMSKPWAGMVGIQLYSVRSSLEEDLSGTLRQLSATGIRHVETAGFYGRTALEFAEELRRAGLIATSMHVPWKTWSPIQRRRSPTQRLLAFQVVCPNLAYDRQLSPVEWKRLFVLYHLGVPVFECGFSLLASSRNAGKMEERRWLPTGFSYTKDP